MPRVRSLPVAQLNQETGAPNPPDRFTPSMPVDGSELMAAWELPPEAWERTSVKTARFKPGSQQMELLASEPISQWNLEDLARSFGAGTYRVQAGPGPYRTKNTTITVSREFADNAGFAAAPMQVAAPSAHDQLAARTFQQAAQGPTDPLQLAAMVQTAVDNALARMQPKDSSLDLILKGFELANSLTTKSMETAKNMLGMPTQTVEPTARTWADVALELGPTILGTFQQMVSAPQPRQHQQAPQQHHHEQRPALENRENHTMPQNQPQNLPTPDPAAVPLLQIMKNYAPMLRGHLEGPATPEQLAEQLAGLLGPDLDPAIIAAAEQIKREGFAVLGHAGEGMATEKAAQTIIRWSEIIQTPEA